MFDRKVVLEDGTVFKGYGFGESREVFAEVKINFGIAGYENVITDSEYDGKIAIFSYPLIGNYGVNGEKFKNSKKTLKAMIAKEICEKPSNFSSEYTIDEVLKEMGIVGIYGLDTRSLIKKLRNKENTKIYIGNLDREITDILVELKK